jgi:hypothetical protein
MGSNGIYWDLMGFIIVPSGSEENPLYNIYYIMEYSAIVFVYYWIFLRPVITKSAYGPVIEPKASTTWRVSDTLQQFHALLLHRYHIYMCIYIIHNIYIVYIYM